MTKLQKPLAWPSIFKKTGLLIRVAIALTVMSLMPTLVLAQTNSESSVRWAGDIPLENSLVVYPEQGLSYDTPNARLMLIQASSPSDTATILGFYDRVLPTLGWQGSQGQYVRDSEQISVRQVTIGAGAFWQILLSPRS